MKFAVVDIETTGLYHQGHGITEVAVVHLEAGGMPVQSFHSLVNPYRVVPSAVEALTGISTGLVEHAPDFSEVVEPLTEALEGRIFVAHNVNFDYRFLESAYSEQNRTLRAKRLCTMRYARKILPGMKSYRLKDMCRVLRLTHKNPHRAGGDAYATASLLKELMTRDEGLAVLRDILSRNSRAAVLPALIDPEAVKSLPEKPGIYYFKDRKGKPIYIGKAKNLKNRVLSHFTASGSTRQKQMFQHLVAEIDFRVLPSEHFAFLAEDAEIRKWFPRFNRAQKTAVKPYVMAIYHDRTGRKRFALTRTYRPADALMWFHSLAEGRSWLYRACLDFGVDPTRGGLPLTEDFPSDFVEEEDAVDRLVAHCKEELGSSFVLGCRVDSEFHFAVVRRGRYVGYGSCGDEGELESADLESMTTPAPDSPTARSILRRMLDDEDVVRIDFPS